jgi:hypothetical protein
VTPTAKKLGAATAALIRFYADIQRRRWGKKFTPKMRAAIIALAWRYESLRARLRKNRRYKPLSCVCKIDRIILATDSLSWIAILRIPGYKAGKKKRLYQRDYRFAQRIKGTGSVREVIIESERTAGWFPPVRITIIPRDETGVLHADLCLLLELLPGAQIKVLEVAWDFPTRCVVDLYYVKRFGLFGKTALWAGSNPYHSKWGGVGSKIVRAYVKWGTSQFRIELELHVAFLRKCGVRDIFDFRKLLPALIEKHVHFARLDESELVRALDRTNLRLDIKSSVLDRVTQREKGSLWESLRYLRRKGHLKNTQRLLVPVPEMNRVVREALEKLVAQWPTRQVRLGRKP